MPHDLIVRKERTGWRDTSLSLRHRLWGYDCPATDIDFLEYDRGRSVALCEWKHERAAPYSPRESNMRARRHLADQAGVPFFVVIRSDNLSWFIIRPENGIAEKLFFSNGMPKEEYKTTGGEAEFVAFLYWLRGRAVPAEVLSAIEASPFVPGSAVDDLRAAWARASAVDRAIFFAEAAAEQANVRPAFKAQQFLAYFQRKKTRQP